jgi:hypothetical protein
LEVVDLAVEDDDDRAVFVEQRLLPRSDVNDRQALMSETDARLKVHAALVGPAMPLRVIHALQHRARDIVPAAGVEDAGDFRTWAVVPQFPDALPSILLRDLVTQRHAVIRHERRVACPKVTRRQATRAGHDT